MQRHIRTIGKLGLVAPLVLTLGAFRWSGSSDPNNRSAATLAVSWLRTQQLGDSSFETAGFAGFETPDAVLAIAEVAQVGPKWNTKRARAAVKAIKINGKSPLHAVDDFVDAGIDAGQAAKVALLVAAPLGLSITDFDPDNDGGVNLQQLVADGQHLDGSFGPAGTLNATLYAMLAMRPLDLLMPTNSITFVRAAQEAGGGWNYAGDATGDYADVDTTSSAIEALIAAGVAPSDPAVRKGLAWLATQYSPSTGAWSSFGADDANSTAVAMIAISAAGYDPTAPCWRNAVASSLKNDAYPSPAAWLRSQQLGSGRIASANDAYGVNTFATSQSVEALMRGFLPFVSAPRQHCKAPKV